MSDLSQLSPHSVSDGCQICVGWVSDACSTLVVEAMDEHSWAGRSVCVFKESGEVREGEATLSDECQIVTAQSTRHMHYIMTCLSGDCVVLVSVRRVPDKMYHSHTTLSTRVSDSSQLILQDTCTI